MELVFVSIVEKVVNAKNVVEVNSEHRCERKKCKQGKYIKTQELELKEKSKPCSKKNRSRTS